ncbi:alpha/beta-hydrolase [Conidiobolus coronatus NRRL 28638]|uniref:Dipeptidyl-peptidase V n=1 Tax=Conidiobolus coronatus (strain ATCC 28846 / CBS 209.66 / NRRL 28638) TaxID=796925 RepID=A0A137P1P8_CONC2|nr:alpha/beta-hydrolase [Conidiobolus coronatus NRRL 28638]|eukprot:KXN68957.1 alpha/beta-hydrolase [Conidiobolus coronatus NRRL 28638]
MRHWDHWNTREKSHLFTLTISPSGKVSGKPKDLLKDSDLESPVEYSGGPSDYVISPDGKWISFGAKKPGRDQAWETEKNIHLVAFDGSGSITRLTQSNAGSATQPIFSPDGKYLSWLSMYRRRYEADRNDIILYDLKTKSHKEIAHKWDLSAIKSYWSHDSSSLFLIADDKAESKLFSVDIKSEKITSYNTPHSISSISQANKYKLLLTISSFGHPNEIFTLRTNGKHIRQLTDVNSKKLKGIYLAKPEKFWFTGALGDKVQGWLLKPINFNPSKKYPVAMIVHGGPQSSYKDRFTQYHNFNLHASAGQVVVSINYHGSTGFGQKFVDSINKNYGTYPVEDHHKGLDHLIKNYSWIDGKRICSVGTSMGGFFGNWFNGHTKRFKCIVQANGMFDLRHWYFTTDEQWFPEYDNGGTPMDHRRIYEKWSPANSMGNFTTPTLVVQGGKDYRIDVSEGIATFAGLQRQGIPSRLLYFPDEGHGTSKPANTMRFMHETVDWVKKWTKK